MGEALVVRYRLAVPDGGAARDLARRIAHEQTVELPPAAVPGHLRGTVPGRILAVRPAGGAHLAEIAYAPWQAGRDLAQLLNLIYGNVSMYGGVRVEAVAWPEPVLAAHPGPRHGPEGLRRLAGVSRRRPLLASALKPMGLDPAALARLAHELAAGGVDLVKDDHGLADQEPAPLAERIARCAEAVAEANARHRRSALYLPNLTGPPSRMERGAEAALAAGCRAALVSPLLAGLDAAAALARDTGLALLAHPALAGAFFGPEAGIAPEVLLGEVFRLAGADGVIFPDAGGRFPFDRAACERIGTACRRELGPVGPAAPVPAGGIDAARAGEAARRWGPDTVLLLGGSLLATGDPRAAAARVREALEETA